MCYCPTPTLLLNLALTGDGAFQLSPQKTHTVWFVSILNYGDTENVLINHLLLVIPVSYPCHYTNLCPHKPHKHAHTHTHTYTVYPSHIYIVNMYSLLICNCLYINIYIYIYIYILMFKSLLQSSWSFRNHSDMLIYNHCLKQFCSIIFLEHVILFSGFFDK